MTEFISFYSTTPNQGKRTLSQSFAKILGNNHLKVLYVELDYKHPSFANSTQISHSEKNIQEYIANAKLRNKFDVEPYILTKQEANQTGDKRLKSNLNELPNSLDLLTFPLGFEESNLTTIVNSSEENNEKEAYEFVKKMIFKLENTKYDYVVMNLPNELHSVFGLSILIHSHKVVNVLTPNPIRLTEYTRLLHQIKNAPINFKNWFTILNQTSNEINVSEYQNIIIEENTPILIPYDKERPQNEFALKIGTEDINSKMEELALALNISIIQTPKRKKSFLNRG